MNGPTCILDASAILAYLYDEQPGAERVASVLSRPALVSSVNWCEVLSKIEERDWPTDADFFVGFRRVLLALEILVFDEVVARMAASLRRPTRQANLSLADRCCLATGRVRNLPVLTADHAWAGLEVGVTVELIR
jgi:ribonuclease VapC